MCCGTLRHSEKISGLHSHRLRLNSTFTPATHRDTSSDLLTDWSVIKVPQSYPHLIHRLIHSLFYTTDGVSRKYSIAILCGIVIIPSMKHKQNFFPTLNSALESEGLLESWELNFPPLPYGGSFSYTFQDGSKHGHYVSIYRETNGMYERPVHYKR